MLWVVFCVMWKNETILQFNTSWLASLRTWYYFRHFFGFSCSGYDLILIRKIHVLNCYSFLLKFFSETRTYKLVVGNCGSSIYCYNDKFIKTHLLLATYVLFNKSLTCYSHVKIGWLPLLFTWTIISSASLKYKIGMNLEVNQSNSSASCSCFIGSITK